MNKKIIFIFLSFLMILSGCKTFFQSLPGFDSLYYPRFGNGYEYEIIANIEYKNERVVKGNFLPNESAWERLEDLEVMQVKIYDIDNNLIAEYTEEYLNIEREKINVENEFWIAYEDRLVLIPEEYHSSDDWQKYIENLKNT
jgi:hypothetical protein